MSRAKKDKAARDKAAVAPPQYCNSHVCWWWVYMHKTASVSLANESFIADVDHSVIDVDDAFFDKNKYRK